jgi:hypothetical protein
MATAILVQHGWLPGGAGDSGEGLVVGAASAVAGADGVHTVTPTEQFWDYSEEVNNA